MKKIVLTMVCLMCILVGLTGCSSQAKQEENADVVGTWKLSAVKLDGATYVEPEYLEKYDYSFTLAEDGSATVNALGVTYTTSYDVVDGWISFTDANLAYIKLEVVDDTLEMQLSAIGGGLVFSRQ